MNLFERFRPGSSPGFPTKRIVNSKFFGKESEYVKMKVRDLKFQINQLSDELLEAELKISILNCNTNISALHANINAEDIGINDSKFEIDKFNDNNVVTLNVNSKNGCAELFTSEELISYKITVFNNENNVEVIKVPYLKPFIKSK